MPDALDTPIDKITEDMPEENVLEILSRLEESNADNRSASNTPGDE